MSEEGKQDQGFRVSDRRRFAGSESGEAQQEEKAPEGDKQPPEIQGAVDEKSDGTGHREAGKKPEAEKRKEPAALPEIDFATFVVSLSSSALIHLGMAPDPITGEQKKDLAIAKQTIDMLAMLQEKTRGNLTEDEAQLMESMLYDLRMRYVAESK
ncbi:MAG: DUF1844 domain-containing protein [Thermodesulfobacteriota bacterium]